MPAKSGGGTSTDAKDDGEAETGSKPAKDTHLPCAQGIVRLLGLYAGAGSLAGRFSSQKPNLQNVTRGALRECFVPSGNDRCLIVADYSQIELRIGAAVAKDTAMLEAFQAREDLHKATAAAVLSKPLFQVTKDDRQLAKAVNFGFLYGQQPEGFRIYARTQYGIVLNLEQATKLRQRFFSRYKGLDRWHQAAWQKAHHNITEARTVFGRLLVSQGHRAWDRFQLHANYVIQGSAADVLKLAMVKIPKVVSQEVWLIATVHDELVFDCPRRIADESAGVIRLVMKEVFHELFPELPIEVEAKICANWAEK
jgi:DNA polymerase I-like protein with 3'-5' exonuclease and polymerase domains